MLIKRTVEVNRELNGGWRRPACCCGIHERSSRGKDFAAALGILVVDNIVVFSVVRERIEDSWLVKKEGIGI